MGDVTHAPWPGLADNLSQVFLPSMMAADFLKSVDIRSFTVDTSDAITFANDKNSEARYVERFVRLVDIDDEPDDAEALG